MEELFRDGNSKVWSWFMSLTDKEQDEVLLMMEQENKEQEKLAKIKVRRKEVR